VLPEGGAAVASGPLGKDVDHQQQQQDQSEDETGAAHEKGGLVTLGIHGTDWG